MKRLLIALFFAVFLVGCGGDEETTPTETSQARVYFLLDDQVWPVAREISEDDAIDDVLAALADGPNEEESEMGLTSAFPDGVEVSIMNGVATVESSAELTTEQRAQLVYALTGLRDPVVREVSLDGESYTRADFEEQTPSVLVESPLPFEAVSTPITSWGTANTFEATFQYELLDADGAVLDENFVTATSGTGTRGTFEFTTAAVDDVAALVVFETSAEDGSRMREVRIPLTTT